MTKGRCLLTEEVDRTESDCVIAGDVSSEQLRSDDGGSDGGSCGCATSRLQSNKGVQSSADQTTLADSLPIISCEKNENRPLNWKDFLIGYPTQSGEYFQLHLMQPCFHGYADER
jgi:hypothetical protein